MAKADAKTGQKETAVPSSPGPSAPPHPKRDPDRAAATFWGNMKKIQSADWGTRANIYLYRVEPITDRLRGGDKKYVMCYAEPISEDKIMIDQGSGRYKAILTFKKPASETGDEVDSTYFDILNPKFPPKIPPGEWLDDPRNKKWAWAKQYAEQPTIAAPVPSGMGDMVGALQVFNEIEKAASERAKTNQPPAPAVDPMVTAMGLTEKLLTIRADNPMVTMMNEQLTAMRAELSEQRKSNADLMLKLTERNNAPEPKTDTATMIKGFIEGLKSLRADAAEILPGAGGRSRLGPWMEFFQPALPAVIDMLKPVAVALARNTGQPNPAQPGQPQIQQPPVQQPDDFGSFLDRITSSMIHFLKEYAEPSGEFAAWLHDGFPEAPRAIEFIKTHGGVPALIGYYRTTKYWATLAPMEAEFSKFLTEVIAWKPEPEQPEEPETPVEDGGEKPIIDMESEASA